MDFDIRGIYSDKFSYTQSSSPSSNDPGDVDGVNLLAGSW